MCQASGSSPMETHVQLSSAAVIIFEHSFYIFDKRRRLQDRQKSVSSVHVALEQYMASPHATAVRDAVNTAVHAYEEAVSAAVLAYQEAMSTAMHTYQGSSSTWMAKLPFKRFQRKAFERSQAEVKQSVCSQAMAKLLQRILEITLQYRLPKP
ncbi:hypothetical protein DEU56DRAFT_567358 [Suillus clintonianus]|uniref:uncharacterized protein n=1 Tax=Suillus clintonianus TaxID=1904413 RepID=UPI001B85ED34|nr:uncharacterized protein DEU56DRAFT_567358 [Suillus clintonianus]KAG2125469.1 hypothetical protein DEU56DRAFT_567358 [Suillus clintonianus]